MVHLTFQPRATSHTLTATSLLQCVGSDAKDVRSLLMDKWATLFVVTALTLALGLILSLAQRGRGTPPRMRRLHGGDVGGRVLVQTTGLLSGGIE
jgi:hypothetical protein